MRTGWLRRPAVRRKTVISGDQGKRKCEAPRRKARQYAAASADQGSNAILMLFFLLDISMHYQLKRVSVYIQQQAAAMVVWQQNAADYRMHDREK